MRPLEKRNLIIKGVKWDIKKVKDGHPVLKNDYGCTDYDSTTIFILKTLSNEMTWATLIHEVLHVIAFGHDGLDLCHEWGVESTAGEIMNVSRQLGILD